MAAEPDERGDAQPDMTLIFNVMLVQSFLKNNGYYGGPVDGFMNDDTKRGISKYQKEKDLNVTGNISSDILDKATKQNFMKAVDEDALQLDFDGSVNRITKRLSTKAYISLIACAERVTDGKNCITIGMSKDDVAHTAEVMGLRINRESDDAWLVEDILLTFKEGKLVHIPGVRPMAARRAQEKAAKKACEELSSIPKNTEDIKTAYQTAAENGDARMEYFWASVLVEKGEPFFTKRFDAASRLSQQELEIVQQRVRVLLAEDR